MEPRCDDNTGSSKEGIHLRDFRGRFRDLVAEAFAVLPMRLGRISYSREPRGEGSFTSLRLVKKTAFLHELSASR